MIVTNEIEDLPFVSEKHQFNQFFCLKFPDKQLINLSVNPNIHHLQEENKNSSKHILIEEYSSQNDEINRNISRLKEIISDHKENHKNSKIEKEIINFNFDFIIRECIISKIVALNINLNSQVIKYFFSIEKLQFHFDFTFKIFLFENSFGMNNFANELFKNTDNSIIDNQYSKYKLDDMLFTLKTITKTKKR